MSDEIVDQENDDDEMEEKLKGDSIGDTLYSEKWVLKTLMKLTQDLPKYSEREDSLVELDETLESDLCLLWDMTSDPDVATCLFKHDIVDLVKCIILHSQAPRLTEIAVGILANSCCSPEIAQSILLNSELTVMAVDLLANEDVQTIMQGVRLLDTLLHPQTGLDVAFISDHPRIWPHINFILQNSLNEDLLCVASRLMNTLTSHLDFENSDPRKLDFNEILEGILECITQLRKEDGEISNETLNALDNLVSVVYNLSRLDGMRRSIVLKSEEINRHSEYYLKQLKQHLSVAMPEELMKLITSSVQVVTIHYVTISCDHHPGILALSTSIGTLLSSLDLDEALGKYVGDFNDILCDCLLKAEQIPDLSEALDADEMDYVLKMTRRTT